METLAQKIIINQVTRQYQDITREGLFCIYSFIGRTDLPS